MKYILFIVTTNSYLLANVGIVNEIQGKSISGLDLTIIILAVCYLLYLTYKSSSSTKLDTNTKKKDLEGSKIKRRNPNPRKNVFNSSNEK